MRSTLLLRAAAMALGAYAYLVESDRPTRAEAEAAKDSLFDVDSLDLVELEVRAGGDRTILHKTDGAWHLVEPIQTGADQVAASGITPGGGPLGAPPGAGGGRPRAPPAGAAGAGAPAGAPAPAPPPRPQVRNTMSAP